MYKVNFFIKYNQMKRLQKDYIYYNIILANKLKGNYKPEPSCSNILFIFDINISNINFWYLFDINIIEIYLLLPQMLVICE